MLTRTFQGGARAGLRTALGLEIGTLIHTVTASLGLSAILATSATAFDVVKYLGAGYLILLGVAAWRKAGHFLPQFVDPGRGYVLVQFLALGLTFAGIGLIGDGTVALLGHRARDRFRRAPRWVAWRERITGGVLVALGVRLALLSRR